MQGEKTFFPIYGELITKKSQQKALIHIKNPEVFNLFRFLFENATIVASRKQFLFGRAALL